MERIIGFYFPMGLIIYVLVWRGGSKNINSKHKYVKANILLFIIIKYLAEIIQNILLL